MDKQVQSGNVTTLLVSDSYLQKKREEGTYMLLEKLLMLAEASKGHVHLITTQAKEQLDALGGIALIKRW